MNETPGKNVRRHRRVILVIVAGCGLIACVWLCLFLVLRGRGIPPVDDTVTTMDTICARMNMYMALHKGAMPLSLDALPRRPGYHDVLEDGWGRKIVGTYDPNSKVMTLRSLGKNGVPGGVGENADITMTIPLGEDGVFHSGDCTSTGLGE